MTNGVNPEKGYDDERAIIDRVACLGTEGRRHLHGYSAIEPDGTTNYWVVDVNKPQASVVTYFPRHEMGGPLPRDIAARVRIWYCGAACLDGHACRVQVTAPGRRCGHHKPKPPKPEGLWAIDTDGAGRPIYRHRVTGEVMGRDTSW